MVYYAWGITMVEVCIHVPADSKIFQQSLNKKLHVQPSNTSAGSDPWREREEEQVRCYGWWSRGQGWLTCSDQRISAIMNYGLVCLYYIFLESLICSVPNLIEGMFVELSVRSPFELEKPKLQHYMVQNQDKPPSPESDGASSGDPPTSKPSEKPSSDLPMASGCRVATPQHAPRPKPSSAPLVDQGKAPAAASPDVPGPDLMKRVVDNLGLFFSGKVDSAHPVAI